MTGGRVGDHQNGQWFHEERMIAGALRFLEQIPLWDTESGA
jgi:hypothetical protein